MVELTTAVKNICLSCQKEDHILIFDLHSKTLELESKLDLLKLELQSQENIKHIELKNALNITLVRNGYETIEENIEVQK